jgi:hypothetical protein
MTENSRRTRARAFLTALGITTCLASTAAFAKLETWKQESAAAFLRAKREGVVVSDNGRVRLGQALVTTPRLDAARVWDLVRTTQGTTYAATGDAGKVFRTDGKKGAEWSLAYDGADTQAFSLAALADGRVFVGTGPSGQVVEVTDPAHPASRPDKGVQYIWDLAADAKGNLYAATGPTGQLWKRSPAGAWSLLLDSKHAHLLCVAVAPDGSVYAGSDGEGLVYRVRPDGKTSIVYDAPQSEVRTLLFAPDGALYAGTAAEASGSGSSGRNANLFTSDASPFEPPGFNPPGATRTQDRQRRPDAPGGVDAPSRPNTPAGGSATPRPASPGENAVYRLDADGVAREMFRARALIFALAWHDDRLLIGTGPEGQIYEVRELGRESAPIARLDNGQVLAMISEPGGGLLIGTGDPGTVVRLATGHIAKGSLLSDVHDTKLSSRFGALSWRADQPKGTSIAFQVRSGNVGEPDETWSAWSPVLNDPDSSKSQIPPGRFVQYRATLETSAAASTPELRAVFLRYQTANLPPEITRLDVPDVSTADGATRMTRLNVRWDVNDPNEDELSYTLHIRKEGWPDWIRLGENSLTEKSYAWDTSAVPSGLYRIRVTATDRPSNGPDDALTRDRESEPFIVDHDDPLVTVEPRSRGAVVSLKDRLTRITKADYAIDGGEWVPVFPDDGLFDTPRETITIALPDLKPGAHVLVLRATDAAGNVGTGDALIDGR